MAKYDVEIAGTNEMYQWRIQDFRKGAPNHQGVQGYDFICFSRKRHEIEKNLVSGGGGWSGARGGA